MGDRSRRRGAGRSRLAAGALVALLLAAAAPARSGPAGLFVDAGTLAAARDGTGETARLRAAFLARADAALGREADPFSMPDVATIRFGKGEPPDGVDDTLSEAVGKLKRDTDAMRSLALAHALTGEPAYAAQATAMMRDWARRHTVVNFYDFDPDFRRATHVGATRGFRSDRPWNFGLEGLWQGYGLINAADAWLLLRAAGWRFDAETEALIRDWLLRLTEAVNASFHAWTRWADMNAGERGAFHATSNPQGLTEAGAGITRHRSDNHLSWALAALLAGAAALGDEALADYALRGGPWTDRRAGPYANPSSIRAVIDMAVEGPGQGSGEAPGENPGAAAGRMFEERIGRRPPIGYALFHLQAMSLAARIAELHFDGGVWSHRGADGAGMLDAFRRYAAHAAEGAEADVWLFALSPPGYGGPERARLLAARPPPEHMSHALGPALLLFGEAE